MMTDGMDGPEQSLGSAIATGAVAGLAAAFLMNCFQIAWGKVSEALEPEQGDDDEGSGDGGAPVKAVEKFQGMVSGRPLPEDQAKTAGNLLHYGFGAVLGAAYAAGARRVPAITAGFGTGYGAGIWAAADEVLVPAAGLAPPPSETKVWTHFYGFVSHLVFGAALEGSKRVLAKVVS